MLKHKKISDNIEQIIIDDKGKKLTWTNIKNPGKDEIEYLRKRYDFSLKHLQASSAKVNSHRPMIYKEDGYLFLILHFPVLKKDHVIAGEIEFFMGHGYVITLHNNKINALNSFFNSCKKDSSFLESYKMKSSIILLYEIMKKLMLSSYTVLDQNSEEINAIEQSIFTRSQRKTNSEILILRRNILNLRQIIQSHKNILKKIMGTESSILPTKQIKEHYFELLEHSKRIWEISDNQKEIIDALYDTNEAMINYRLNDIMKTLTIFSIIFLPLNLLASIFGMNFINMPLLENYHGFQILLSIMAIISMGLLIFFIKKKWL